MRLALDYDGTYTLDPAFWERFKELAASHGHEVFFVTKRGGTNKGNLVMPGWETHNTDRVAKSKYCNDHDIEVDIWIDDDPVNIWMDA